MATTTDKKITPAMQQFHRFKKQHPGCVLFFRMGDFYEMFYDDAELAHRVLGVTLTQRTQGIPMAGVPYHAVDSYLQRMVKAGHRVAMCDQVEDAAQAKGVVKRDVTRVITPGTLTDEALLADDQQNPLAAVIYHDQDNASLAWAELSTGSFSLATLDAGQLADELARINPSELLYCQTATDQVPRRIEALSSTLNCVLTPRPVWQFRQGEAAALLKKQYQVAQLGGFGFADDDPALSAAGAVLAYLLETQCSSEQAGDKPGERPGDKPGGKPGAGRLNHLQPPRRFERSEHLIIDQSSLGSLEIERTARSGSTQGSLLNVLQGCVTAMGKRLLRQWLCYPLCRREPIEKRQAVVESLVNDSRFRDELRSAVDKVHDVARIIARLAVGRAAPRDLVALGSSAKQVTQLEELLSERSTVQPFHQQVSALVEPLSALAQRMHSACVDGPPAHLRDGGLIRDGYDAQLDEYRLLQSDSHAWLARYQKHLIQETGVSTLKVGYNRVFGYYIELTAANKDKAPDSWTRKQTLKNAERFITPELKAFEGKALSAQSRAVTREQDIFTALCDEAQQHVALLQEFADLVGQLDVLGCFANVAVRYSYVKPEIVPEPVLNIVAGRHPVLDQLLGDRFVPNDVVLGRGQGAEGSRGQEGEVGGNQATLALITGPNMAGKSTYIRQTALIVLLAHTGSFVPATAATIGLCDRIFTRIGASDELHAGQSTFMVEMTETANICHHATAHSLIVLDEIGRGTSTLDGLSLAWAIAEHLADKGPRCLFATHYHELTTLAEQFDNVCNLNVTVREWQDEIVFLHRIVPGATDRSYGIHVAKIAGLPATVVARADQLLGQLTVSHEGQPPPVPPVPPEPGVGATQSTPDEGQLSLFGQVRRGT